MKRRILALVLTLALALGMLVPARAAYTPEEQYDLLRYVEDLIRTEGLESSPDDDPLGAALLEALEADPTLFERMMSAMLSRYDSHTMFVPAGRYSQAFDPDTGYVGVGVTLTAHPQGAEITELNLLGSAAAQGLKMGDILTEAAGKALRGMALDDIAALLRGPEGSTVAVKVLRGGETLSFTLTRTRLETLNYFGAPVSDGVFYMKWDRIDSSDASYYFFRRDLLAMEERGDRYLILDLRGNPGGSLDLAFSMVSDLLPEAGSFFRTAWRDPESTELEYRYMIADGEGIDLDHIYVLVDGETASAAEVIAASLRDTGRGTLIGSRTYGKGRAQYHIQLEDDAAVVLTTMMLLPLEGEDYEGIGLAPQIAVEKTLLRGENALVVPDTIPLAPGNCSDNAETLNRALVSLGWLKELPEKPYQLGEETLAVLTRMRALYSVEDDCPGAGAPTFAMVNTLLDRKGAGRYFRDDPYLTALDLAQKCMNQTAEPAQE